MPGKKVPTMYKTAPSLKEGHPARPNQLAWLQPHITLHCV
jgi:hypothetical protein